MPGFHNKLGDSIASLFKRRQSNSGGGGGDSRSGGGQRGSSSSNGRISTPQNVKRVMHITFDPRKQSFDGIPNQWRQYFGAPAAASAEAETAAARRSEAEAEVNRASTHVPELAARQVVEPATQQPLEHAAKSSATGDWTISMVQAEDATEHEAAKLTERHTATAQTMEYAREDIGNKVAENQAGQVYEQELRRETTEQAAEQTSGHDVTETAEQQLTHVLAEHAATSEILEHNTPEQTAEHTSERDATEHAAEPDSELLVRRSRKSTPRVLLSLVYDRDVGRFVNLPPHWEERLKRNSLIQPEFQTDPKLLAMVFSLMDEELRSMREEGSRVESCLYTSLTKQQSQPHYLFQIEADKSNSSSELDLADPFETLASVPVSSGLMLPEEGSFVTVSAVEIPEELDTLL